jgi:hypothetical protein
MSALALASMEQLVKQPINSKITRRKKKYPHLWLLFYIGWITTNLCQTI